MLYAEVELNGAKTNRCSRATGEMASFVNKESSMKNSAFYQKNNGAVQNVF